MMWKDKVFCNVQSIVQKHLNHSILLYKKTLAMQQVMYDSTIQVCLVKCQYYHCGCSCYYFTFLKLLLKVKFLPDQHPYKVYHYEMSGELHE